MYLAQIVDNEEVSSGLYIDIFENIVSNPNSSDKSLVDGAILEAVGVANGKKDIFSIDNSYYFLVTTLLQNFNRRLIELKSVQSVPSEVYPQILSILR